MKTAFAIAAFAATAAFASCRSYDANDADVVRNEGTVQTDQDATIDSLKLELAKQRVIDSMQEVARLERETLVPAASTVTTTTSPSVRRSGTTRRSSSSSSNYSNNSYAGSSQPVYSQPAPAPVEKRGMSAKAKGAIIGAGTGAVTGAVINKRDRAKGAIIGGVLGAGAGTGVGAIIDKKNGR